MNGRQKTLLIALAGTLALVLVIILALTLLRGDGDGDPIHAPADAPIVTATPAPTASPISEQEMENLALSEEGEHDVVDVYDPETDAGAEPID